MNKLIYARNNSVACPAPFTKISITSNNKDLLYSCCCNLDLSKFKNFEQLQTLIRDGKQAPECNLCYSEESRGVPSERMNLILNSSDEKFAELCDNFNFRERELFVKFSNLCTLACRSCAPTDSSTYAKITNSSSHELSLDITDDLENWNKLTDLLTAIHQSELPILHAIGGETLVQPGFYKTIKWLIDNGYSEKFELRLTTSLAVNLTDKILDAFKSFRIVCLNLSIDSVGDNYHYIRWPAKFEKIEQNLKIIANFDHPRKIVIIQPLLSINNIFYLDKFIDYFFHWIDGVNFEVPIRPIYLHNPAMLDVTNLPNPYKKHAIECLERILDHELLKSQLTLAHYIESIIQNLRLDNVKDPDIFLNYLKYTADFDCRTQTDFSFYNKLLWDLLTEEHRMIYAEQQKHFKLKITNYVQS